MTRVLFHFENLQYKLPRDGILRPADWKLQSATSVWSPGNLSMAKLVLPVNYDKLVPRGKFSWLRFSLTFSSFADEVEDKC